MYVYFTYTYIIELCQQVFIYNEEAQCLSHFSDDRDGLLFS